MECATKKTTDGVYSYVHEVDHSWVSLRQKIYSFYVYSMVGHKTTMSGTLIQVELIVDEPGLTLLLHTSNL